MVKCCDTVVMTCDQKSAVATKLNGGARVCREAHESRIVQCNERERRNATRKDCSSSMRSVIPRHDPRQQGSTTCNLHSRVGKLGIIC